MSNAAERSIHGFGVLQLATVAAQVQNSSS
jgi:hypothetical protein